MARPYKTRLDYFPFDVNFFEDKKIKRLRARHGNDGVIVYMKILCLIYKDNGYYMLWSDEDSEDVADDLNISINSVRLIIKTLLERSLFDNTLFQLGNVLTSRGIQRRYLFAMKDNARKSAAKGRKLCFKEYCLITEDDLEKLEMVGLFDVTTKKDYSENNDSKSQINMDKSEINDIKEKKNKLNYINNIVCNIEEDKTQDDKLKFEIDSFEIKVTEYIIKQILNLNPKAKVPNTEEKIVIWAKEIEKMKRLDKRTEEEIIEIINFAFEDTFWQTTILGTPSLRKHYDKMFVQMKNKYKKKEQLGNVKQNRFHNFEQKSKNYTAEQLEEIGRRNFMENIERIKIKTDI